MDYDDSHDQGKEDWDRPWEIGQGSLQMHQQHADQDDLLKSPAQQKLKQQHAGDKGRLTNEKKRFLKKEFGVEINKNNGKRSAAFIDDLEVDENENVKYKGKFIYSREKGFLRDKVDYVNFQKELEVVKLEAKKKKPSTKNKEQLVNITLDLRAENIREKYGHDKFVLDALEEAERGTDSATLRKLHEKISKNAFDREDKTIEGAREVQKYINEKLKGIKPPFSQKLKNALMVLGVGVTVSSIIVSAIDIYENRTVSAGVIALKVVQKLRESLGALLSRGEIEEKKEAVKTDNREIEQNLEQQQETVAAVQQEKAKTVSITKYDNLYKNFQKQMKTLRKDRDDLKKELRLEKSKYLSKNSKINRLQTELHEKVQEMEKQKEASESDREELAQKLREIKTVERERDDYLQMIQEANDNANNEAEVEELQRQITNKNMEISTLKIAARARIGGCAKK